MPPAHRGDRGGIGQRFLAEMREYLYISLYLWVCLGVLLLYKTAILREEHIQFTPLGVALVKALILGKFILIGKAVGVGARVSRNVLLIRILGKTFGFLLLLMVLSVVEELVVGLVHGHSAADAMGSFTSRSLLENIAPSALMLLILIPLITFEEVDHALGKGTLRRTIFGRSEQS